MILPLATALLAAATASTLTLPQALTQNLTHSPALTVAHRVPIHVPVGAPTALSIGVPIDGPIDGPTASSGEVRQIGTYGWLSSPNYSGLAPLRRVVAPDSIGLGTFRALDGELVVLDGTAYRVPISGKPQRVSPARRTPFAQAIEFHPTIQRRLPAGVTCDQLVRIIDDTVGTARGLVAVTVKGNFTELTTRSVPRQERPWPALAEVTATQTEFDLSGRRAQLVGFRTGPDLNGASPVGVHLHGLTADLRAGGHVLSCRTGRGVRLQLEPDVDLTIIGR